MNDDLDYDRVQELLTRTMAAMTGSVSDMIRAAMGAQVDGLIDARKRLAAAGWEDWMINNAIDSLIRQGIRAPTEAVKSLKGDHK